MSEYTTCHRCHHGAPLWPYQHRLPEGDILAQRPPETGVCRECYAAAEEAGKQMARAHGVRMEDWEGTTVRGRVRDIVFSPWIGKYVVLLSPGGFATISPKNVHAFERDGRVLGDSIGEWWHIVYGEDGDIWGNTVIRPTLLERLLD